MKHEIKIVFIMMVMFIVTQLIGLLIINTYAPHNITLPTGANITQWNQVPYGMQPEPMEPNVSLMTFLLALTIAIALLFLLMKYRARMIIRIWFMAVSFITIAISLNAIFLMLFPESKLGLDTIALVLALPMTFYKVFRRNIVVHNFTELLIYPGLAVLFIPIFDITTTIILLVIISIYDFIAVIKSKFMVQMAKYEMQKAKIFSGFFVPYLTDKTRKLIEKISMRSAKSSKAKKIPISVAILGGGDIAFPLIFAGVVLRTLGLTSALFVIVGASLGLLGLFIIGKKGKFYPAMPFIAAGCIAGWLVSTLI